MSRHQEFSKISDFILTEDIGEGNFGKVKLGIYKKTGEKFAIKILNKEKIKEKMKNTLFKENEIAQKFNHINVIYVYKIFEDKKNIYIVMEYCKKGELFNYIVEHRRLSEKETSIFFYQLINGIEHIHSKNISHRDLKPENLLLTENNILKIIDFGLSHEFYENGNLLKTKCGSPSYAAPELICQPFYDGFKSDIWCCGIILYAMLCGFLPFEGEDNNLLFRNILECDPELPDFLSCSCRELIIKILNPDPDERITIDEIKKHKLYLKGKSLCNINYDNDFVKSREKIENKINLNDIISENNNNNIQNVYNLNLFNDEKNVYNDNYCNLINTEVNRNNSLRTNQQNIRMLCIKNNNSINSFKKKVMSITNKYKKRSTSDKKVKINRINNINTIDELISDNINIFNTDFGLPIAKFLNIVNKKRIKNFNYNIQEQISNNGINFSSINSSKPIDEKTNSGISTGVISHLDEYEKKSTFLKIFGNSQKKNIEGNKKLIESKKIFKTPQRLIINNYLGGLHTKSNENKLNSNKLCSKFFKEFRNNLKKISREQKETEGILTRTINSCIQKRNKNINNNNANINNHQNEKKIDIINININTPINVKKQLTIDENNNSSQNNNTVSNEGRDKNSIYYYNNINIKIDNLNINPTFSNFNSIDSNDKINLNTISNKNTINSNKCITLNNDLDNANTISYIKNINSFKNNLQIEPKSLYRTKINLTKIIQKAKMKKNKDKKNPIILSSNLRNCIKNNGELYRMKKIKNDELFLNLLFNQNNQKLNELNKKFFNMISERKRQNTKEKK